MKKKIFIFFIVIGVVGIGFYYFIFNNDSGKASSEITQVNLEEVKPQTITTRVSADGNSKTIKERDIKIGINGLVKEVYVEEGDKVIKGEKLIKLDKEKVKQQLEIAKLDLKEAEKNYDNLYNNFKLQNELNELQLKEARRNLKIALLSRDKEKIELEDKEYRLQEDLDQAQRNLKKVKENLEDRKHLFKNEAISENKFNNTVDEYEQAEIDYNNIKHELKILTEKTIPNSTELSQLKVENAQNKLNFLKANLEKENITENDLELAQIKVVKAEKQISDIKQELDKMTVFSPIKGTILEIQVKSGDKVSAGSTVGEIADIKKLMVEVMVDEIDINEVKIGQKANISSDSFAETLPGMVKFIAPRSNKVGNINKYKTEIELKETRDLVKPGMFVNAEIVTNHKENILALPSLAVMGEKDKYVFIVKEGKAEKKSVEVGLKNLSRVEVKGIKAGEKVIIGPFTLLKKLKPGIPVMGNHINKNQ